MKKNKFNSTMLHIGTTAALLLSADQVMADSKKIFNPDNSHYYQRFDKLNTNFFNAETTCEGLKSHLATFTDDAEYNFVYLNLISQSPNINASYPDLYIGMYFDNDAQSILWVTGEKNNFNFGFPSSSYPYMSINAKTGDYTWRRDYATYNSSNDTSYGYVCEWDGNNYVGTADVPDIDGNGVGENAILYHDYKTNQHTVDVRDPKEQKSVIKKPITFDTSSNPPVGFVIIPDMNGIGHHGVAVLSKNPRDNVKIKDITNNKATIKPITFLTPKYKVRAISIKADENDNGFAELTVVGVLESGKTTVETRDSNTGDLLYSDQF